MSLVPVEEAYEASLLPRVMPAGWRRVQAPGPTFVCDGSGGLAGISVIFTVGTEEDGQDWIHLSACRRGRTPSWDELSALKSLFLGDRYAYQVFPPRDEHYSLPEVPGTRTGYVLHLWARVDGRPVLPNFLRWRGGTL